MRTIMLWSMKNINDIRTGRHCVFNLHVHLVFVTKYRRNVFTKTILDEMKAIFERVCLDFEAELVEFDGEDDHVHLLVNYPPKIAISSLVNSLKGVSSRVLRTNHSSIKQNLWGKRYGRQAILRVVAEVRLLLLLNNILSNKIHLLNLLLSSYPLKTLSLIHISEPTRPY